MGQTFAEIEELVGLDILGMYETESTNIILEFQLKRTLIHIEFENNLRILDWHRLLVKVIPRDLARGFQAIYLADEYFLRLYPQFQSLTHYFPAIEPLLLLVQLDYGFSSFKTEYIFIGNSAVVETIKVEIIDTHEQTMLMELERVLDEVMLNMVWWDGDWIEIKKSGL